MKSSAVQAAGIAAIPMIVSQTVSASPKKKAEVLSTGDVILFQGDSITDAGRNRERQLANDASSFGTGYALMAAASILEVAASRPERADSTVAFAARTAARVEATRLSEA